MGVLTPRLRKWMEELNPEHTTSNPLRAIGPKMAAQSVCEVLLERLYQDNVLSSIALAVGCRVEKMMARAVATDPSAWTRRARSLSKVIGRRRARLCIKNSRGAPQLPLRSKLQVGLTLLALVEEWTDYWEFVLVKQVKTSHKVIRPTDDLLTWVQDKRERYQAKGVDTPQEGIPRFWGPHNKSASIRRYGQHVGNKLPPSTELFDALNAQQLVTWRVNKKVLEVVGRAFESGMSLADLPPGAKPELNTWVSKREWAAFQGHILRWQNKRRQFAKVLADARTLPASFHFWWTADFRGRVYVRGSLVHPQGQDLGRALLEFANGQALGESSGYLAHHGANLWGLSRASYAHREKWVRDNQDHIIKSAEAPLDYRWWAQASDPWRFLAFCFEWLGYVLDGPRHVTHLPCQIDGTCNGFQILALVLKDEELGRRVNCIDSEDPQDLYTPIAETVTERIRESRYGQEWLDLLGGSVPRSLVKSVCLASTFGGSGLAGGKQVMDWFWDNVNDWRFSGRVASPCFYLAAEVSKVLREEVPQLLRLQAWCRSIASTVTNRGDQLRWSSPIGVTIETNNLVGKLHLARVCVNGRWITCSHYTDRRTMKRSKVVRSAFPHLIHSLDAAAMVRAVNVSDFDLYTVHDSFGALAPNMRQLHQIVRFAYKRVFSEDVLAEFAGQVEDPPPLELGDLNPESLLRSRHFFT